MNEWMSATVGFDLSRGTGWIRPIQTRADWPLGRLSVNREGIRVASRLPIFRLSKYIPWESVNQIHYRFLGMEVEFTNNEEHYQLMMNGWCLWSRFQSCLNDHHLKIPIHLAKTVDG